MVSPVYSIILIVVGVLLLVGVAALAFVCGILAWQSWALVKINRIVGESIAAAVDALKQFPAKFDALAVVVSELKGFEEGEVNLLARLVKSITSLDRTVEEFEACLIAPPASGDGAPRRGRRTSEVTSASEGEELIREQQRKERQSSGIPEGADFGKNVATV